MNSRMHMMPTGAPCLFFLVIMRGSQPMSAAASKGLASAMKPAFRVVVTDRKGPQITKKMNRALGSRA